MKKVIYTILSITMLTACKKESSNPSTNTTNTTCIDNPNINFTSNGTPVGKFGECIKDIEGNTYKTVTIGSQTWMAENLKVTKYIDGTNISNLIDTVQWNNTTLGAWSYYNNDASYNIYGKLYNWYTISNNKICPTGWHIPTLNEWAVLTDFLGGDSLSFYKLIETGTIHWNNPNLGNNISLFTILPAGVRYDARDKGKFEGLGNITGFWASDIVSSESIKDGATNLIINNSPKVKIHVFTKKNNPKGIGVSIRCLKD
jgi:uncharacterized protein (TIGR02145 family)